MKEEGTQSAVAGGSPWTRRFKKIDKAVFRFLNPLRCKGKAYTPTAGNRFIRF